MLEPTKNQIKVVPKTPANAAKKALELLYQYMQEQTGEKPTIESFYPVDLDLLTKLLGWELDKVQIAGYSELGEILDAKSHFDTKKIFLTDKPTIHRGRIKYSHAHELGHIMLHADLGLDYMDRTQPFRIRGRKIKSPNINDKYEVEADRFAADLLMPQKAVLFFFHRLFGTAQIISNSRLATEIENMINLRQANYESDFKLLAKKVAAYPQQNDVASLADIFLVTNDAMAVRLIELGHISP
jgi:hypothetical protein